MKIYQIENDHLRLSAISTGATIVGIEYKQEDAWQETVLSYENLDQYKEDNKYYLNSVIGPHAGRIKNGNYLLDGTNIQLEQNDGGHHLHGGSHGFHTLDFTCVAKDNSLVFKVFDSHYENKVEVRYSLEGKSVLISYCLLPKYNQVINMTQHMYFNLSNERTIENHEIWSDAGYFSKLDDQGIPSKDIISVENTPFDFRNKASLKEHVNMEFEDFNLTKNIDHPIKTKDGFLSLESRLSKIGVKAQSDAEYMIVYTANYFDNTIKLKNRKESDVFSGITIEPQDLPNDVNLNTSRSQIYGPKRPYKRKMRFDYYDL